MTKPTKVKGAKELIVQTNNRDYLDKALQQLGGLVSENALPSNEYGKNAYIVRTINGDIGFLKFACEQQGYAKVICERQIK